MPNYRRLWQPGGTYFFTVTLLERRGNDLLVRYIDNLRQTVGYVRERHPFAIHGWVVLPDHLHCIIELPRGDMDYSTRISLIKQKFSKSLPAVEYRSEVRQRRRERGIWQRRYWEHQIRDDEDMRRHIDYIHYNPVKHGHVGVPVEWPFSSLHQYIRLGKLSKSWGAGLGFNDDAYGEVS